MKEKKRSLRGLSPLFLRSSVTFIIPKKMRKEIKDTNKSKVGEQIFSKLKVSSSLIKMVGINNTKIVEKKREYGIITEWEARHKCIGDVWETITKQGIEEKIPVRCLLCNKDIVVFEK